MSPSKVHRIDLATFNTLGNLPSGRGERRAEFNFMREFEKSYFKRQSSAGLTAEEFSLSGFGVADMVWIGWQPDGQSDDFSAVAIQQQLARRLLYAFEGKLKDWRRALQQAFRYRYFADKAIVVMPLENAGQALANLETFRNAGVGLWTFEAANGIIKEHFTPTRIRAFNPKARAKAIALLASKFDFGQFRKESKSAFQ